MRRPDSRLRPMGKPPEQRESSALRHLSSWARSLPPSRTKSRAGRVIGAALAPLGADPVVEAHTGSGWFVLDARSRTESSMLWNGAYDEDDIAFLRAITPTDGTFMDIGANVGLIFIPVMNALSARGRAIAVEPVAVNFERLSRAVPLNDPDCAVDLLPLALGRTEGTLSMVKEGPAGSSGNAVPALHGESGVKVRLATVDGVCGELGLSRLDTVKIDVEGFEVEVLSGAVTVLERFRPVVYGEFNNQLMPQRGVSFRDVWSMFQPVGYKCFSFGARMHLVPRPDPPAHLGNAVLIPEDRIDAARAVGVTFAGRSW